MGTHTKYISAIFDLKNGAVINHSKLKPIEVTSECPLTLGQENLRTLISQHVVKESVEIHA